MPNPALTQSQIDEKLRNEDLDEWLELWWASQGGEKRNRGLELMATALPFGRDEELLVLDMCCGPGDIGRFIRNRFPKARIDCVDRDPFLLSLCGALNRRAGITGQTLVRDMWDANWHEGLPRSYDVVASAAALHWFDVRRLGELFGDVFRMLRPGGAFMFAEPASAETPFAAGFEEWRREEWRRSDPHYDPQSWDRFWSKVATLLGYDHRQILESRPHDREPIGDNGIPVRRYVEMLTKVGYEPVDILLIDTDKAVIASIKPPV
ncbi:MAG TPA: class I SAM-dependent methyltransferase [Candidatus Binataceae bacterium]|nr:class I SAM-dependent methyltransferase [Candidatus Binataceae bacterium]